MDKSRRVVVTGMGTVNPLGHRVEPFWQNIKAGKSGVGPITKFDTTDYPSKIAGEVRNFDPYDLLDRKEVRNMADFSQYALYATVQAVNQAHLGDDLNRERCGVYLGNGIGGFEVAEENVQKLLERGPRSVAPLTIPKLISNEAAGNIALKYQLLGPCHTTVTACASGTDAIGAAYHAIKWGQVDLAVTGGTEGAITKLAVSGFSRLQALSTAYNATPQTACRPFDATRDGFVIGEGAGILILEALEHAQKRGAEILGEVMGYAMSCDAYHLTAPSPEGEGAARAMQWALEEANLDFREVDYINAHGTSTPANDVMETKAIKRVFKEHAYTLKVSSTKSMTSHLIGAAGAVEAIVTLLALRDQYFPCTLNLTTPDAQCDLDYVANVGQKGSIRSAMSVSLGFGGHNGVLLLSNFSG
ncbi:MAG: beta-ketoacyl-ACP synthase II [Sphaerochaetaceae bacterium]